MTTVGIADIIIVHSNRILLVQQRKPNVYGKWGFPGGHIEEGESAEEAIVREINEELGLTIPATGLSKTDHRERGGSEGELAVSTFVLYSEVFLPKLQVEELIGFGWFTLDELKDIAHRLRSPWMIVLAEKTDLSIT